MLPLSDRLKSHDHASASSVSARHALAGRVLPQSGLAGHIHAQKPIKNARRISLLKSLERDTIISSASAHLEPPAVQNAFYNRTPSPAPTDPDSPEVITRFIAETLLPTKYGKFRLRGYKHSVDGGVTCTEPTAILVGDVANASAVPVRVHDACFTSEVLGSMKCDCAEQLQLAMQNIQADPPGIIIYLQQEGRGIGLANKIAAYSLQEQGLDTVDANRALGLPDDCREYTSVRNILKDLRVKSVRLITNNPRKINVLTSLGVEVVGRIPCLVKAGEYNQGYLDAKRDRMEHLLDGSWCFWNHDGEPAEAVETSFTPGGMQLPNGLKTSRTGRVLINPPMNGNGTSHNGTNYNDSTNHNGSYNNNHINKH